MALEDILAAIDNEAETEASRIIGEAEQRARVLLDQVRAEAEAEADRLSHGKDEAAAVAVRRITSRAHLDAARARRAARESIYRQARDRVAEKLKDLRTRPDYREVLRGLLEEALAVAPDAKVARVGEEDVDLARDLLNGIRAETQVEPGDVTWGGVVLIADGQMVYNDLGSRLDRADHHLRFIAADMFPELRGGQS
ncbi:MAG TPA: V-type ATP synthase subunit E [Acidimicrobiia bacterium]|jgi:vacuolar-type H+-ATPase subunit E/Vma4